tara:strand:- start:962 stop:1369 length:408 start_codon:yes stop_codon:yes gene_type:complete
MTTVRIRKNIKKFLGGEISDSDLKKGILPRRSGPASTSQIIEYINKSTRDGTTTQQLGNILSKDKDIVKIGYVRLKGMTSGPYNVCNWALKSWADEHMDLCGYTSRGKPIYIPKESSAPELSRELVIPQGLELSL